MPQLCAEHWERARAESPAPLAVNVVLIQRCLDAHGVENGDYCPVCRYDDGEALFTEALDTVAGWSGADTSCPR